MEKTENNLKENTQAGDKKYPHGWLKSGGTPCDIRALPKCQAKAKSTGQRCGNIAMKTSGSVTSTAASLLELQREQKCIEAWPIYQGGHGREGDDQESFGAGQGVP